VQNKPNFEERTGRGRGRLCETKPNLGGLGYLEKKGGVIVCGTIVKTKGLGDATRRQGNRAKQTQFRRLDRPGANWAKRTQFPALPGGTGPQRRATRGNCAKQTQFGPAQAGPSPGWTKDAKRSQFAGTGSGWGTDYAKQTQLGRAGPRRAKCAKRTQFGPAWAGPGPGRAKDAKRTQLAPWKASGGGAQPMKSQGAIVPQDRSGVSRRKGPHRGGSARGNSVARRGGFW
jgi:hypothetical protein